MSLALHNSLTRREEPFAPLRPPEVLLYACGPTVYNAVHIGNWSSFLFYDTLVRWLRESGYRVRYVVNLTDVDDKIIRDATAAKKTRAEFTEEWTRLFFRDLERLGCLPADANPRATDHIEAMARMIQALLDRGHAYLAEDGSIYFRIASFPRYGQLKRLTPESLRAGGGGRVRADEYEKEGVGDFALWKAWTAEDGEVAWAPEFRVGGASRVVRGRPGWHIECSAMSAALLGEQIDIHLGGEDLLFPHHENEIAQSEAASGKHPFVRFWLHRRHLLVDGQKMSKSKKNFYTLDHLAERGGERAVRAFRFLVVTTHYRSPIDFTWAGLEAAGKTLQNLEDARRRLAKAAGGAAPSGFARARGEEFAAALDRDLETSAAIAAVQLALGEANRATELAPAHAASVLSLLDRADRVFGLGLSSAEVALDAASRGLLEARGTARAARDWKEADRLRQELLRRGWVVKDGAGGAQEVSRA
jgi:cysteinyl-tRNA synthetase